MMMMSFVNSVFEESHDAERKARSLEEEEEEEDPIQRYYRETQLNTHTGDIAAVYLSAVRGSREIEIIGTILDNECEDVAQISSFFSFFPLFLAQEREILLF